MLRRRRIRSRTRSISRRSLRRRPIEGDVLSDADDYCRQLSVMNRNICCSSWVGIEVYSRELSLLELHAARCDLLSHERSPALASIIEERLSIHTRIGFSTAHFDSVCFENQHSCSSINTCDVRTQCTQTQNLDR
jgi:hypothetical protein